MNPAALKTNIGDLPAVARDREQRWFTQQLNRRPTRDPLTDETLQAYTTFEVPISSLNERSLDGLDMTNSKGLTRTSSHSPDVLALRAEHDAPQLDRPKFSARRSSRCEQGALSGLRLRRDDRDVPHPLPRPPASCRGHVPNITGNEATGARVPGGLELADRSVLRLYPITPASDHLHQLSGYSVRRQTFQAEDERAIGAATARATAARWAWTASSARASRSRARRSGWP